jgi:hypothetical protein
MVAAWQAIVSTNPAENSKRVLVTQMVPHEAVPGALCDLNAAGGNAIGQPLSPVFLRHSYLLDLTSLQVWDNLHDKISADFAKP